MVSPQNSDTRGGPPPSSIMAPMSLWNFVVCKSFKTITTDKLHQRIDYYSVLIYTQSSIWYFTRPHYSFNFGSEKIGPRTIKQRQNVTKVALFGLLN